MMNKILLIIIFPTLILFSGCVEFMAFQGPKVLSPDKHQIGFGLVKIPEYEDDGLVGNIQYRKGLVENVDCGIQLILPLNEHNDDFEYKYFQVDYKHQLKYNPDFSYSLSLVIPHSNEEGFEDIAFNPMGILGYKDFYIGHKRLIQDFEFSEDNIKTIFFGYEFNVTDKISFRPEINLAFVEFSEKYESFGFAFEVHN